MNKPPPPHKKRLWAPVVQFDDNTFGLDLGRLKYDRAEADALCHPGSKAHQVTVAWKLYRKPKPRKRARKTRTAAARLG